MNLIGRLKEQDQLEQCIMSGRPEFMVVYGRRRVGKTYLIKEFFNNVFSFYSTGMMNEKTRSQLKAFNEALTNYGDTISTIPTCISFLYLSCPPGYITESEDIMGQLLKRFFKST